MFRTKTSYLPLATLLSILLLAAVAPPATAALPIPVYENDFQAGGVLPEWSSTTYKTISTTANGCTSAVFCGTQVLVMGHGTYTLTLTGLPAHTLLQLDLDMLFINSWDGDGQNDRVRVTADGVDLLPFTTFSNIDQAGFRYTQSYPGAAGTQTNPPFTGSFESGTLGNCCSFWGNSVYRFPNADHLFQFAHSASTVVFTIEIDSSEATTDCGNECLGIDNVVVTAENTAAPVPELGTVLLLATGLVGIAAVAITGRRR